MAIGATLAGLILTSNRGLRKDMRDDMKQGESRLREDMGKLESRLRDDIKQLGERVARVEHGQAKLEGLLEGLREAITGRVSNVVLPHDPVPPETLVALLACRMPLRRDRNTH